MYLVCVLYPFKYCIIRTLTLVNTSLMFLWQNYDWSTDFSMHKGSKLDHGLETQSGGIDSDFEGYFLSLMSSWCKKDDRKWKDNEMGNGLVGHNRDTAWCCTILKNGGPVPHFAMWISSPMRQQHCPHPPPVLNATFITDSHVSCGPSFHPCPHINLSSF